MMKTFLLAWALWALTALAFPSEYGLTGVPANIYDPYCATACLRSFYTLTLNCSSQGVTVGMVTFTTTTECYAENTPYLTSVAWCAHTKCADEDVSASLMEYWWEQQITGQKAAGVRAVPAKWSYGETLARITSPPTLQLTANDTLLNTTSLVPPSVYLEQHNVLFGVQQEGTIENIYGLAILITGFATPILFTVLSYIPGISNGISKLKPYLLWPSTIGRYHCNPLPYLLGNAPTIGQSLYIALFVILNIILTAVSYHAHQPNAWYATTWREIMGKILARTGNFAYIMMPLIFLFASRNNILLWMSNWSHETYLVLHRWVGRVFMLQAVLHSIVALIMYCEEGMYSMNVSKPYWIWGIVATFGAVLLCFGSGLYVRSWNYEIFLITHIVLSVITVVGCWYHAYDLYAFLGGYCYWLFAVFAVWGFDRVARVVRILFTGSQRANVTDLGDEAGYVRVDIPNVRWTNKPGMHAYLYFPTLTKWTPWENHPFSVMPTVWLQRSNRPVYRDDSSLQSSSSKEEIETATPTNDLEKSPSAIQRLASKSTASATTAGLTFFVKKTQSFTKSLIAHDRVLTLIEGPYPSTPTSQILLSDRLILIGGGIGITSLAPFLRCHSNVKLYWSVKDNARCLIDELSGMLEGVEKDILVGGRFDVGQILSSEASTRWKRVGVVVSGPAGMCDDVRALVVEEAKRTAGTTDWELEVEGYSW